MSENVCGGQGFPGFDDHDPFKIKPPLVFRHEITIQKLRAMTDAQLSAIGLPFDLVAYLVELRNSAELWRQIATDRAEQIGKHRGAIARDILIDLIAQFPETE